MTEIWNFKTYDMILAVLTYNVPHRKTQDLLHTLRLQGHDDVAVIGLPFEKRNNFKPLYVHRPLYPIMGNIGFMIEQLGYEYSLLGSIDQLDDVLRRYSPRYTLIAGAGILPESVIRTGDIINSHPGWLPNVRGLDALKWAILEGQPIGVTTHFIDENTDQGILIERSIVPVYYEDTFHAVAYRQYDMEIQMLARAPQLAEELEDKIPLMDETYPVHRRMPHHQEIRMMERFEQIRKKSPSRREVES